MSKLRELVQFADEEGREWVFDIDFMLSTWHCIYGAGCKGVDNVPWHGCCNVGAFLDYDVATRARELRQINGGIARMRDDEFASPAHARQIRKDWKRPESDNFRTRIKNGACIFLNPPTHPNGPGCSLHQAALARGERPQDWKPEVCAWMAMYVVELEDQDEDPVHWVMRCENRFWTPDHSYEVLDWFCTEDKAAYEYKNDIGPRVYELMGYELRRRCGDGIYEQLTEFLDKRSREVPITIGRRDGDGYPRH